MISNIIEFAKKHKNELLVIISLGLTFNLSINFTCNGEINFNLKTLVFVYSGYQALKQITKGIAKNNTK